MFLYDVDHSSIFDGYVTAAMDISSQSSFFNNINYPSDDWSQKS